MKLPHMTTRKVLPEDAIWHDSVDMLMRNDPVGGNIDGAVNRPNIQLTDRTAYLKYNFEELSNQVNSGFVLLSSFEDGSTLTLSNEVLLFEQDGQYYRWTGDLPKNVVSGSTPDTTGGFGGGAWVLVGDGSLRAQLKSTSGAEIVGLLQGGTVQKAIWYKTPEMFGAVGDGVADDTVSLQDALTWLSTGKHRKLCL